MMNLYTYWRSTAAYRVRITLNLKDVEYRLTPVNLVAGEQHEPSYAALNPQSLVPVLETSEGLLMQSTAIVEYLEEQFPQPPLLPNQANDRARVRAFCQTIACDVHPLNNLGVLNYLKSDIGADDAAVSRWYAKWVSKAFTALESVVSQSRGRYCFGDTISMADIYLVPQMFNAKRFECDVSPYPILTELVANVETHPAFATAAPALQPDAP